MCGAARSNTKTTVTPATGAAATRTPALPSAAPRLNRR